MNHNHFYQESTENHVEDKGDEEEEDYRRRRPPPPPPQKRMASSSSTLAEATIHEHGKVGESSRRQPRLGLRSAGGGEIVEVHGGHIVRSIGRKDRHSKVCTAKGPRDRRVRLAAHTAIQFYDVQDRLGYDRPSKAVDWLIKKAKSAIDELAQLPAWHPSNSSMPNDEEQQQQLGFRRADLGVSASSGKRAIGMIDGEGDRDNTSHRNLQDSTFLPPSLDSDAIADTIKSFFPVAASAEANSSAMEFHSFQNSNLLPRNASNSQDLRLSLQSIHDPIMLHHHNPPPPPPSHQNPNSQTEPPPILLTGPQLGFDATSAWSDWNSCGGGTVASGYFFHSPPAVAPQPLIQQLLSHNQFLSQRGPLQSSNSPSIRAWMDPSTMADNSHQQQQGIVPVYPSSMSAIGYAGGFSGFHIPARIHGDEEEEHDGYSDKPSSASSDSRH